MKSVIDFLVAVYGFLALGIFNLFKSKYQNRKTEYDKLEKTDMVSFPA